MNTAVLARPRGGRHLRADLPHARRLLGHPRPLRHAPHGVPTPFRNGGIESPYGSGWRRPQLLDPTKRELPPVSRLWESQDVLASPERDLPVRRRRRRLQRRPQPGLRLVPRVGLRPVRLAAGAWELLRGTAHHDHTHGPGRRRGAVSRRRGRSRPCYVRRSSPMRRPLSCPTGVSPLVVRAGGGALGGPGTGVNRERSAAIERSARCTCAS
jgi:hypothetical protein